MKPNFTNQGINKILMVIQNSQRLTFGSLQQPPDQHHQMGPFGNSLQLICINWHDISIETGLYQLFYDPEFCKEYGIKPLLQSQDSSVPLKDNHLKLAVEALNNCPSDVSHPAKAVIQWVVFWIDYCLEELEQPTAFCYPIRKSKAN